MARIKLSGLVSEISGSIGGATFQRNAYGLTLRTKNIPTNSFSAYRNAYKIAFYKSVTAWQYLTDAERSAWNSFARTYPVYVRKDSQHILNGRNFFVKYHCYTLINPSFNNSILTTPVFSSPPIQGALFSIIDTGSGLTFFRDFVTISSDLFVTFYVSRPLNRVPLSYPSTRLYDIRTCVYTEATGFNRFYLTLFPISPVLGQYIYFRVHFTSKITGHILNTEHLYIQIST